MLINKIQNSSISQKQKNIVQGFKVTEDEHIWSNILCRHVMTGRVKAHKLCLKNYECYHCAYDQMIDDEDMDFLNKKPVC